MALSTYVKEFFAKFQLIGASSVNDQVNILAEDDGTLRQQLVLKDPSTGLQVAAAADDSGDDKGALHVKLKGTFLDVQQDSQEDLVKWLKIIAYHLAELRTNSLERNLHVSSLEEIERKYK
jgi:hypothetical protein